MILKCSLHAQDTQYSNTQNSDEREMLDMKVIVLELSQREK